MVAKTEGSSRSRPRSAPLPSAWYRRASVNVVAVIAVVLLSEAAPVRERVSTKICTKMDCADQVTINVRASDGQPPRDLAVELNIDGKVVSCPAPAGDPAETRTCAENVTLTYQEIRRCRGADCQGTGAFEHALVITGAPRRVRLEIEQGAKVLARKVVAPSYGRVRPNGPGCPPVCRQAIRTWRYR